MIGVSAEVVEMFKGILWSSMDHLGECSGFQSSFRLFGLKGLKHTSVMIHREVLRIQDEILGLHVYKWKCSMSSYQDSAWEIEFVWKLHYSLNLWFSFLGLKTFWLDHRFLLTKLTMRLHVSLTVPVDVESVNTVFSLLAFCGVFMNKMLLVQTLSNVF